VFSFSFVDEGKPLNGVHKNNGMISYVNATRQVS